MKYLLWAAAVLLALLIEQNLSFLSISPNLSALVVYAIGVRYGEVRGLFAGLAIGFITAYIIAAWLVFVVLALQVRRVRYMIMVFPLLSLMASYGLGLFRLTTYTRFIVYSTVAFSLTLALSGFLPFLQHTSAANLRDAAEYMDSLDVALVEVFTPLPEDYVMSPAVSVPLLDIYTKKKIVYRYEEAEYPLPEDLNRSALRFTWTYRNPLYYEEEEIKEHDKKAVLVITDSIEKTLPLSILQKIEGLPVKRTFEISDTVFRHKTLVTVFH